MGGRSTLEELGRNCHLVGSSIDVPFTEDLIQRTLPIAVLSLAVLTVPVLVLSPDGLPRLRALQSEVADVAADNQELRRDLTRLRVEVRRMRDDPAAVERIARDELGMVRKSEIVFHFGKP